MIQNSVKNYAKQPGNDFMDQCFGKPQATINKALEKVEAHTFKSQECLMLFKDDNKSPLLISKELSTVQRD